MTIFIGLSEDVLNKKEFVRKQHLSLKLKSHGILKILGNVEFCEVESDLFYVSLEDQTRVSIIKNKLKSINYWSDNQEAISELYLLIEEVLGSDAAFYFLLLSNEELLYFSDLYGKKTVGISSDNVVSTVNFEDNFPNSKICRFNFRNNILKCYEKPNSLLTIPKWEMSTETKNIENLMKLFELSVRRHTCEEAVVFFSGGIDSFIIALFILKFSDVKKVVLINTAFGGDGSPDRKQSFINFELLKGEFPHRNLQYIGKDVSASELIAQMPLIRDLASPKHSKMHLNIASVLFFTCKAIETPSAKVFLGSGADELFGGYKRYFDSKDVKKDLLADFNSISNDNLSRDQRVLDFFGLDVCYTFLDRAIAEFALACEAKFLINGQNKYILREMLREMGFASVADIKKVAMQFGSGIRKYEDVFSNFYPESTSKNQFPFKCDKYKKNQ